jgi:hypothetical protein
MECIEAVDCSNIRVVTIVNLEMQLVRKLFLVLCIQLRTGQ